MSVVTENDSTPARNDLILAKHFSKVQSMERSKAIADFADHQKKLDNNLQNSIKVIKLLLRKLAALVFEKVYVIFLWKILGSMFHTSIPIKLDKRDMKISKTK